MRPTPASASSRSNSTNHTATVRSPTSCHTQNRLALSHPLAPPSSETVSAPAAAQLWWLSSRQETKARQLKQKLA